MSALFKSAIVIAFGLAIGLYSLGSMSLENVVKSVRLERIVVLINEALSSVRPQAVTIPVDLAAARRVDEDLDYLTAERTGSLEGWRAFLARHGSGSHAQSASSEIDELLLSETAPMPAAAQATNGKSPDATAESEPAPPAPLSLSADIAVATRDEASDQPDAPPGAPARDEGAPSSRGDGKVQPQPASLMDGLSAAPEPASTATPANVSAKDGPDARSKPRDAHSRHRAALSSPGPEPTRRARPCAFRFECHWRALTLQPILMALLGERPKHAPLSGRTVAEARSTDFPGR